MRYTCDSSNAASTGVVQFLCRSQVPAERLFDDDPHPGFSVGMFSESGLVELLDNQRINLPGGVAR